jgi:hypothetical protein
MPATQDRETLGAMLQKIMRNQTRRPQKREIWLKVRMFVHNFPAAGTASKTVE